MEKKGQVTIFIIIAIVIVAGGVLVYLFFPQIKSALGREIKNPQAFIQECIEEEIGDAVEIISLHGGSVEPEFFSTFDNVEIRNLCYTAQYCDYEPPLCSMQEPQLNAHIKSEIKDYIRETSDVCFASLKENYDNKGYSASLEEGETVVDILPERIVVTFNKELTLVKEGTEKYEEFAVVLNNNLYELTAIADSILGFEVSVGSVDVTIYMELYSHLRVEQRLLGDDTKIYIITDRDSGDKFQFASRSLVLSPAGYC